MNLIEGIQKQIARNREILKTYESIPQGAVGAMFIRKDIEYAEKAMVKGDTVAMLHIYKTLQETKI